MFLLLSLQLTIYSGNISDLDFKSSTLYDSIFPWAMVYTLCILGHGTFWLHSLDKICNVLCLWRMDVSNGAPNLLWDVVF